MDDKSIVTTTSNVAAMNKECSMKARVDSLIREFLEQSFIDKKCRTKLFSWKSQDTKLSVSNWSKETTYNGLRRKIKLLQQTIVKYTKIDQIQKQKLTGLQIERARKEQKMWDDVQFQIVTYEKSFPYGQTEYSIQNLTKDMETYYRDYVLLCEKIINLQSKLKDLMMTYNLRVMEINSDICNLHNVVNSVKNKNSSLLSGIRFAEDALQELKNKLKQTEMMLLERKKIRENAIFRNFP